MINRLSDPFELLLGLQDRIDRLRGSGWLAPESGAAASYPAINVFQKDDHFIAVAELPGLHSSDITVQVEGGKLRIAGQRREVYADEAVQVHRRERRSGAFDRTLSLPVDIDAERVRAEYHDGILAVMLPRAERHRARTITVQ